METCRNCGKQFEGKFCPQCGTPVPFRKPEQSVTQPAGEDTEKPEENTAQEPVQATQNPNNDAQPFKVCPICHQPYKGTFCPKGCGTAVAKKKGLKGWQIALIVIGPIFAAFILFGIIISSTTETEDDVVDTGNTVSDISNASSSEQNKGAESSYSSASNNTPQTSKKEYISENQIDDFYSNPSKYYGKYIKLTGKVFSSVEKSNKEMRFQMYADPEELEKNTVIYYGNTDLDLKSDDYISLEGKITFAESGTNLLGGKVTAPAIQATSIKKIDYITAVSPTIKTFTVNKTVNQHNCKITVEKVEVSKKETRVYVTAKNDSKNEFSIWAYSAKLVQNGKQYEHKTNYDADYPEVQTDLLPGTESSGIITFEAIDPGKDLTIHLEGHSDDYSLDFNAYEFTAKAK